MAYANNSMVKQSTVNKGSFSIALSSDSTQNMLKAALGEQKAITKFTTDIMAAFSSNPKLKECDHASIISAGLQCAALNLSASPALGEAYIIPYGDQATFQVGKDGLVQLAIRSGAYTYIDTFEIRQGEYKGKDKFTGKPVFEFVTDDEVRENLPVIGYLATFELKPEMGGFKKSVYFSKEKVLGWAKRYSKAFDEELLKKYETYLKTGEGLSQQELNRCSSPWISSFDRMGEKTVLKQALKHWGPKSVDMQTAISQDDSSDGKPIDGVFTVSEVAEEVPVADAPVAVEATVVDAPDKPATAAKGFFEK